jgi:hypothetical protein
MLVNVDTSKIEIDAAADREWIERIAKTTNEICDDPECNRIKLTEQHTGLIIESNDAGTSDLYSCHCSKFGRYLIIFFNRGNYSLSEMVYSLMLQAINTINPSLCKGLPLYQIGIAQIGNLDEGISNVLKAAEEDDKNQPAKAPGLPTSQTRQKIIHHVERQIDAVFLQKLKNDLPSYFNLSSLASLLSKLSFDEQLFLVRLILGRKRLPPRNDSFTKIIMFNNLLNVYVLTETFLGKAPNSSTLGDLIRMAFCKEKWFSIYSMHTGIPKRNHNTLTYYDDYNVNPQYQYHTQLQKIASKTFSSNKEENFIVIMFLSSYLTRNYLAHHFNPTSPIFSNINEYDRLFDLAVIMLLYCLR